jgi:hypothetical protein
MSVQEYYRELEKGMIRCGVVEEDEDKVVHFSGGLNQNIQDIIDYKEYDSIQHLFQLAMLADKIQRHNLFHIFFIVNDCHVLIIIDGGSFNNLVNSEVVKKLGLTTRAYPHPYNI